MTLSTVLLIALAALLVMGNFLVSLLELAIPLAIAGVIVLFALGKFRGGTALDHVIAKLMNWVDIRIGGRCQHLPNKWNGSRMFPEAQ